MSEAERAALGAVAAHFDAAPPETLGVAVSGGSDSVALLSLLDGWRGAGGPALRVATVDHGLRPEARAEAEAVARLCAGLGLAHDTLHWHGRDAEGNLPDQARRARYRLLTEWAHAHDISDVAIGHTEDDLAETFLMRLARGAGVDGLSAMRARWQTDGVTFHRPLLSLGREHLRDILRARNVPWAEDPTNSDPAYARTQARAVLGALSPLGLTSETLASTARNLAEARSGLALCAREAAGRIARVEAGDLLFDRGGFAALPDEIARRLLVAALRWLTGQGYPPRGAALHDFLRAARDGHRKTLQGCVLSTGPDHMRLGREYHAVASLRTPADMLWDGRWQAEGPGEAEIRALGPKGLAACPDWRAGAIPHASAMACPGLWRGETLIAAPPLGWENGWRLYLAKDLTDYLDTVISH